MPLEAGFCCLRQGSNETHFGQRQQTCLWKQGFVASAMDPMKLAKIKGNHMTFDAGIQLPLPSTP
jgi:hypothetical protein